MSVDTPSEPENLIVAAVDAAEEIRDPLDGLVEKTAIDPGALSRPTPATPAQQWTLPTCARLACPRGVQVLSKWVPSMMRSVFLPFSVSSPWFCETLRGSQR